MTKSEYIKYKLLALMELNRGDISEEHGWIQVAERSGIPEAHWDSVRDMLYNEGLIHYQYEAEGTGHVVKGDPMITSLMLKIEPDVPALKVVLEEGPVSWYKTTFIKEVVYPALVSLMTFLLGLWLGHSGK